VTLHMSKLNTGENRKSYLQMKLHLSCRTLTLSVARVWWYLLLAYHMLAEHAHKYHTNMY